VWSAACATGEEPYSIAMAALEQLGQAAAARVKILATDISSRALEAAREGIYPKDRCEGVPPALQSRYLLRGCQGRFRVRRNVRALVEFRRLNLIEPFSCAGSFEVIFCRNVMIYFDRSTREVLAKRLARALAPGGWLFTGHAESLAGIRQPLEYIRPAVYRRPGGVPA
jgi:chemotaxis protein methyltransferase CheR